jgi:hypothetical protein
MRCPREPSAINEKADSLLTAGRIALRAAFSGLLDANHRPADGRNA